MDTPELVPIPPADYTQITGYFVSVRRTFTRKRVKLGGYVREFIFNTEGELVAEGSASTRHIGWDSTTMRADVAANYWENHHQQHKALIKQIDALDVKSSFVFNMGATV